MKKKRKKLFDRVEALQSRIPPGLLYLYLARLRLAQIAPDLIDNERLDEAFCGAGKCNAFVIQPACDPVIDLSLEVQDYRDSLTDDERFRFDLERGYTWIRTSTVGELEPFSIPPDPPGRGTPEQVRLARLISKSAVLPRIGVEIAKKGQAVRWTELVRHLLHRGWRELPREAVSAEDIDRFIDQVCTEVKGYLQARNGGQNGDEETS